MNTVTRVLLVVLRRLSGLVPAERRDWVEAVWAEVDEVRPGWGRMAWLLGGVRLLSREAHAGRTVAFGLALAGFGVVDSRLNTPHGLVFSTVAATALVVMLAGLPVLGHWYAPFGPVRPTLVSRLVRIGGYLAICMVALLGEAVSRYGNTRFSAGDFEEKFAGDIFDAVLIFVLFTAYSAGVLAVTARRSGVTPSTLAIGVGTGVLSGLFVCAMTPFGHRLPVSNHGLSTLYFLALTCVPLALPIAAGGWAARRARTGGTSAPDLTDERDRDPVRQGLAAGLCVGGAAALLGSVLTTAIILRWPLKVPLMWANPDATVPHGTGYELAMTVSDSADRYLPILLFAPLVGAFLGVIGSVGVGADWAPRKPRPKALVR
jgi:hypothetical protein